MFEVGDRRMPSEPGWAGWVKRQGAVSVMNVLKIRNRVARGEGRLLSLEGFLAPV
jgi:hypothetical protein